MAVGEDNSSEYYRPCSEDDFIICVSVDSFPVSFQNYLNNFTED